MAIDSSSHLQPLSNKRCEANTAKWQNDLL